MLGLRCEGGDILARGDRGFGRELRRRGLHGALEQRGHPETRRDAEGDEWYPDVPSAAGLDADGAADVEPCGGGFARADDERGDGAALAAAQREGGREAVSKAQARVEFESGPRDRPAASEGDGEASGDAERGAGGEEEWPCIGGVEGVEGGVRPGRAEGEDGDERGAGAPREPVTREVER